MCVVTFNITINLYSIICTIYSSRLLINTICSICLVSFSNITNSSTRYINTTIRTIYFTIYRNTILSIFSVTNSSSYINTTIRTSYFTIYRNTNIRTSYFTIYRNTIMTILKLNTLI